MKINRHTLSNGLRLVHVEDMTTQMVALNTLYKVGARNENPEQTGFAHLFEHLMFGGSINIPDYDGPSQLAGAENNAWTNNDITNFYITIPHQNVETAFWLESDRMLSLAFSDHSLEVQRNVVMEEFKQRNLNEPYGDVEHLKRSLAFKVHPYQWPTIGKELSHIAGATMDDVKRFFHSFYAPNNAVLAIIGHITFEEAVRLTEKWYGEIERREVSNNPIPQEPEQTALRLLEVERNVPQDHLYMMFHMTAHDHPDYHTFDLISDILSNGQSARLIQHLVQEQRLLTVADAHISGSIDPGLITITGHLCQGTSFETVEEAIWKEIDDLKAGNISDHELEKVKNVFESTHIYTHLNNLNIASAIAFHESISQAEDFTRQVELYRRVTKEDIARVATQYLTKENCSILRYKGK